jgi:chromosome segregation ATPase
MSLSLPQLKTVYEQAANDDRHYKDDIVKLKSLATAPKVEYAYSASSLKTKYPNKAPSQHYDPDSWANANAERKKHSRALAYVRECLAGEHENSGSRGGGVVELLRNKDEENASLNEQLQNALQKNEQLEQQNKQLEQQNNLLQVDNNQLREGNASLKTALSAVQTTINCFGNLDNRVAKMEDKQDELGDQFEEFGEGFDNLKTDVDYVTASHEELGGKVDAEIERREEKEYEYDDNMWKLSTNVEDVRIHVDDTADVLRQERQEELDEAEENIKKGTLALIHEEFAAEMDDQNVNIHKVQNDLLNQQDQMDQMKGNMDEVLALAEQAERPNSRMSFP